MGKNKDKKKDSHSSEDGCKTNGGKLKCARYEEKLDELPKELVKMQYWIKESGQKVVILFEGRDAAGKGGSIKTVTEPLNPRGCRVVALGTPSDAGRHLRRPPRSEQNYGPEIDV